MDRFRDSNVNKVIQAVSDLYGKGEQSINPGKLLSRLEKDEAAKTAVMQAIAKADITREPDKALDDCIFCVLKENREEELKELTLRLKKAQEANNDTEMKSLLTKINKIHKEKVA